MRKIIKNHNSKGANLLNQIKSKKQKQYYDDLDDDDRRLIRNSLIEEQYCLCAYCTARININNSHNEHIIPKGRNEGYNKQLNYNNLIAACRATKSGSKSCVNDKKSKLIPITPLMDECETEFKFRLSGRVEGLTEKAKTTINTLKFNNKFLKKRRKEMVTKLLLGNYSHNKESFNDLKNEDNEVLQLLKNDLLKKNDENCLEPYSPILINILNQILPQ